MRKVIGIGETVFDIIFDRDNRPISGKPGGSVYNAMISLGRCGVPATFISEVGNDRVGDIIKSFMRDNGVDVSHICTFEGSKSPLALAFLDENRNAQYQFYKDYPAQRLRFDIPPIASDDVLLMGSYFALMPQLRPQVKSLLDSARSHGALIYYDVNFRRTHAHELNRLMPTLSENFDYADIVKGSDEDFKIIFGTSDIESIYRQHFEPHCKVFVCTRGAHGVELFAPGTHLHVPSRPIEPVSTVGAGDSFNAGFIYGLLRQGIGRSTLDTPTAHAALKNAIQHGVAFSAQVCMLLDNYISELPGEI